MKRLTTEEFIKRAKESHGDIYDYSITEYKNSTTKISYICPKHGIVEQNPRNHLKGNKCKKCIGRDLSKNEWIDRFILTHGYTYDYSKFEYHGIYDKSIIICKKHGEFLQNPHNHSGGQGCVSCARETVWKNNSYYNPIIAQRNKEEWCDIPCNLYIVRMFDNNESFYKIGITSQSMDNRFRKDKIPYNFEILHVIQSNRYDSIMLETKLQDIYKQYSYSPKNTFGGHTECFTELPNIEKEII